MDEFGGKAAVITGAASGIGLAIARRFAREGMRVVLSDIEAPALQAAVDALREAGAEVDGVVTDVSDAESVRSLRAAVLDRFGPPDVVVSNAGVEGYMDGYLWQATDADWDWTLGVNYGGAQNMVRTFLPGLVERDTGYLVITASVVSAWTSGNLYELSKHAVLALAEAVYCDLRTSGSHVGTSVLMPGGTATNLFFGSRNRPERLSNEAGHADPDGGHGREVRRRMFEMVSHATQPDEVADALLDGIREDRFYVLTTGGFGDEFVRTRAENILSQTNPTPHRLG